MPRELEYERDELAELYKYFGNSKHNLTCKDVATYCGITPATAKKRYNIGKNGISLVILSKKLCAL